MLRCTSVEVVWDAAVHCAALCCAAHVPPCSNSFAHPFCRKRAAAYRELAERQQRQEKLGGLAQQMAYDKQVGADALWCS